MIPESRAPLLPGLDEFRTFMGNRGLSVRREYMPPAEDDEVGYWQVLLVKEELRFDGKLYAQVLTVGDRDVRRGHVQQWEVLAELLEVGFQQTLEENLVSDEDERVHRIRKMLQTPDWQLQGLDSDFIFLLEIVDRLKSKELLMQDELKYNWAEGAKQRNALDAQQELLARAESQVRATLEWMDEAAPGQRLIAEQWLDDYEALKGDE